MTDAVHPRVKYIKRPIHGVLLLNKPRGISSNAGVQAVKRLLQAEKAGHTGTLDPLAEGLLPVCLGESTKFSAYQLEADKTYHAVVCLGIQTTTGDVEGAVVRQSSVRVSREDIAALIPQFLGQISQIPPMYSALKVAGKPLYAYAREGVLLERQARTVHIRRLTIRSFISPQLEIEVQCSAGTYIRSLAEDIGSALGCGAHLLGLTRVASGGFDLHQAVELDEFESMNLVQREALLLPVDALVQHLPSIDVNATAAQALSYGRGFYYPDGHAGMGNTDVVCRVMYQQEFLGLVRCTADGQCIPQRLMKTHSEAKII